MLDPAERIRGATSADVEAVVSLVESAYRGDASRAGWTTEADLLGGQRTDAREISGIVSDPRCRLFLCFRNERLAGCVLARLEGASGHIGMLAVQPTEQASGLGRLLLGEAEKWLIRDAAVSSARMTVIRQRPELIAWYERRGYRRTGETEPFPSSDPRFGLPRRDDLEFVVLEKRLG
jgi:ribosomal protein S18 acetylase RimI-like enzyme